MSGLDWLIIPPARTLDDLALVADALIDCGDPGRDPGDEDDREARR